MRGKAFTSSKQYCWHLGKQMRKSFVPNLQLGHAAEATLFPRLWEPARMQLHKVVGILGDLCQLQRNGVTACQYFPQSLGILGLEQATLISVLLLPQNL